MFHKDSITLLQQIFMSEKWSLWNTSADIWLGIRYSGICTEFLKTNLAIKPTA